MSANSGLYKGTEGGPEVRLSPNSGASFSPVMCRPVLYFITALVGCNGHHTITGYLGPTLSSTPSWGSGGLRGAGIVSLLVLGINNILESSDSLRGASF